MTVRHWLPILTFCPVNKLPDLLYVSVEFPLDGAAAMMELYGVRKRIRQQISGRCMFMEEVAEYLLMHFDTATAVEVRLWFNRHVVRMERQYV